MRDPRPRAPLDLGRQALRSFAVPRQEKPNGMISHDATYHVTGSPAWYFTRYNEFLQRTEGERGARAKLLGTEDGTKLYCSRSLEHETIASFLRDADELRARTRIEVLSYDGDRLEVTVSTPEPAFLSFIDNWDPDWEATVQGERAPLRLLFGTFKAVAVPGGEARVVFVYRPRFSR
jgi:hypothetical protein